MGREDQIEEREVLESIFPDEITGATCLAIDATQNPSWLTFKPGRYI